MLNYKYYTGKKMSWGSIQTEEPHKVYLQDELKEIIERSKFWATLSQPLSLPDTQQIFKAYLDFNEGQFDFGYSGVVTIVSPDLNKKAQLRCHTFNKNENFLRLSREPAGLVNAFDIELSNENLANLAIDDNSSLQIPILFEAGSYVIQAYKDHSGAIGELNAISINKIIKVPSGFSVISRPLINTAAPVKLQEIADITSEIGSAAKLTLLKNDDVIVEIDIAANEDSDEASLVLDTLVFPHDKITLQIVPKPFNSEINFTLKMLMLRGSLDEDEHGFKIFQQAISYLLAASIISSEFTKAFLEFEELVRIMELFSKVDLTPEEVAFYTSQYLKQAYLTISITAALSHSPVLQLTYMQRLGEDLSQIGNNLLRHGSMFSLMPDFESPLTKSKIMVYTRGEYDYLPNRYIAVLLMISALNNTGLYDIIVQLPKLSDELNLILDNLIGKANYQQITSRTKVNRVLLQNSVSTHSNYLNLIPLPELMLRMSEYRVAFTEGNGKKYEIFSKATRLINRLILKNLVNPTSSEFAQFEPKPIVYSPNTLQLVDSEKIRNFLAPERRLKSFFILDINSEFSGSGAHSMEELPLPAPSDSPVLPSTPNHFLFADLQEYIKPTNEIIGITANLSLSNFSSITNLNAKSCTRNLMKEENDTSSLYAGIIKKVYVPTQLNIQLNNTLCVDGFKLLIPIEKAEEAPASATLLPAYFSQLFGNLVAVDNLFQPSSLLPQQIGDLLEIQARIKTSQEILPVISPNIEYTNFVILLNKLKKSNILGPTSILTFGLWGYPPPPIIPVVPVPTTFGTLFSLTPFSNPKPYFSLSYNNKPIINNSSFANTPSVLVPITPNFNSLGRLFSTIPNIPKSTPAAFNKILCQHYTTQSVL